MERLIVSITSFKPRIKLLKNTLKSLVYQTYKDFDILLTFEKNEYEEFKDELNEILSYFKNLNIQINLVDINTYCHKNTFEAMKLYPNNPILVLDEDVFRTKYCIEEFINDYQEHNCIIARDYCYKILNDKIYFDDIKFLSKHEYNFTGVEIPHTGKLGILYPPNCFKDKRFYDPNLILECSPTSTEMWIFYWCKKEKIPIYFKMRKTFIFSVYSSAENCLGNKNSLENRLKFYNNMIKLIG